MLSGNDALVKKLLQEDPAFKKSYHAHRDCEKVVAKLEKKPRLTAEEEKEKVHLKKLKLSLKDEMEKIMARRKS